MPLRVRVSHRANQDVDPIYFWIAVRSAQGAIRLYDKFLETLQPLPTIADGMPVLPEVASSGIELRQFLFKTRKG